MKTVFINNPTWFRSQTVIVELESHFTDYLYHRDRYWDDDFYDQENFEFLHNFDKSPEQIEDDDLTVSHLWDNLR